MPTAQKIFLKNDKSIIYEWFIYLFPDKKFFKILMAVSDRLGVNMWDPIQDELWVRGLIAERGPIRLGIKMKHKFIKELLGMELSTRKHKGVHESVQKRQDEGKERLKAIGRLMKFDVMVGNETHLVMWSRSLGFLVNAGIAWVYVYRTGNSFEMDKQFPIVGYFHTNSATIESQLCEAMNGDLMNKTHKHEVRRRIFITRKINRMRYQSIKRKQS
jgi:hypothetical protein